jgi:hypothetical protein
LIESVRFAVAVGGPEGRVGSSSSVTGDGMQRTSAALDGAGLLVVRPWRAPLAGVQVTR